MHHHRLCRELIARRLRRRLAELSPSDRRRAIRLFDGHAPGPDTGWRTGAERLSFRMHAIGWSSVETEPAPSVANLTAEARRRQSPALAWAALQCWRRLDRPLAPAPPTEIAVSTLDALDQLADLASLFSFLRPMLLERMHELSAQAGGSPGMEALLGCRLLYISQRHGMTRLARGLHDRTERLLRRYEPGQKRWHPNRTRETVLLLHLLDALTRLCGSAAETASACAPELAPPLYLMERHASAFLAPAQFHLFRIGSPVPIQRATIDPVLTAERLARESICAIRSLRPRLLAQQALDQSRGLFGSTRRIELVVPMLPNADLPDSTQLSSRSSSAASITSI